MRWLYGIWILEAFRFLRYHFFIHFRVKCVMEVWRWVHEFFESHLRPLVLRVLQYPMWFFAHSCSWSYWFAYCFWRQHPWALRSIFDLIYPQVFGRVLKVSEAFILSLFDLTQVFCVSESMLRGVVLWRLLLRSWGEGTSLRSELPSRHLWRLVVWSWEEEHLILLLMLRTGH